MKLISVVVPCYNEQEVFSETMKRLTDTFKSLDKTKYSYEMIFVNDGSKDNTREIIEKNYGDKDNTLSQIQDAVDSDSRVKGINFSRNFGHQIAITAGLDLCKGDAAVVIDADLQDPPYVILQMIEKWEQGYEVVGLMLRLWAEAGGAANRCCTPDAVADARRVAKVLGIPFYVRD